VTESRRRIDDFDEIVMGMRYLPNSDSQSNMLRPYGRRSGYKSGGTKTGAGHPSIIL